MSSESTADYVKNVWQRRSKDAEEMLAQLNSGEEYPEGHECEGSDPSEVLMEYPLSIERKVLVQITLGTGGPGDWIEATCRKEDWGLEIESATYHATWGSDSSTRDLWTTDPLYKLAEYYVESVEGIE